MRFSTFVFSGLLAALSVSAQNTTTSSAVVSGTFAVTPAQASYAACLKTCASGDVKCQAACALLGQGTNPIALCEGTCVQGNGTSADNLVYENCIKACISTASNQPTATPSTSGSGTAATTSAGGATGSGAVNTGTGTATGTGASASTTKNAAENLRLGASVAGIAGIFIAIFAL